MPDPKCLPVHFRRRLRSFTLVELMVVLVIIGGITALAIPKFTRSVTTTKERRALNSLYLIHDAQVTYQKHTGAYWPPSGTENLAAINSNLTLNLLADGDTYTCRFQSGGYECQVEFDNGDYELELTEDPLQDGVNPCCSSGACPITPAC